MNNFFTLNAATYEDEKLLFDWINDIDVRRWSFNQNKILLNNHKTWFNNKINDNNVLIWIFRNNGCDIGMVRLEKEDNQAILNYLISASHRGKHYATPMLKMAMQKVKEIWSSIRIVAYTLSDNYPSIKSLEGAGFILESSNDDKNCFVYNSN